jgi:RNase H-fold protein (predicted Holliday junction resolvase)
MKKLILGASVGTRSIGLALVEHGTVLDWQIKSFKQSWSEKKLARIIDSIAQSIDTHTVDLISIKIPCDVKNDSNTSILLRRFETVIQKKQITLHKFTLSELKSYCKVEVSNVKEMMHSVTDLYPCMYKLYTREMQNRNPYHLKVFEAILAAHCAQLKK